MLMSSTSIVPDRIKGSSNRFQNHIVEQVHEIRIVARSSPSQSWVDYTMIIEEAHKLFHTREEAGV